jgi:hypothetical protein
MIKAVVIHLFGSMHMTGEQLLEESFRLFRLVGDVNQIIEQKRFLEGCQEEGGPFAISEFSFYDFRLEDKRQYDLAVSLILKEEVPGWQGYDGYFAGESDRYPPRLTTIEKFMSHFEQIRAR